MKNSITTSTVSTPAPVEVIRNPDSLAAQGLLVIEGDRVSIRKGADVTTSELALFIQDREATAGKFKTQARWAFYSAGMLPNGSDIQKELAAKLGTMLSKSALYQLTSEATTLCPLVIAEGIKAPLSVLKDAMAELETNEATGKLLPLSKQTKAAKELIPLLKAGAVTQAAVRDIRKKHAATPAPRVSASKEEKEGDDEARKFAAALSALSSVSTYLDANKVAGDDAKPMLNVLCDIARKLGASVVIPNAAAPKAPAAPASK